MTGRPARVVVGLAPLYRRPDADAPIDTFYQYGEPVLRFAKAGRYAWCQSLVDGYVGYVALSDIAPAEEAKPTHFVATLGSYRYAAPDLRSRVTDFLPRHSPVVVAESDIRTRGTEYVRLDSSGFLPLSCLSPQPPRSPDLVAAAELYLGCPYLWGGRSFLGCDCSGLIQSAFRDLGIGVLRDTDMQREAIGNRVAAADERDLRPGDLLYLEGHVLIYRGDGEVIHADGASMMVRRERLAQFLGRHRLELGQIVIRRHPAAIVRPAETP